MQLTFRLNDELSKRFEKLVNETNRSKSHYLQEAVKNLLDDYDDYKEAMMSINESKGKKTYSLDEISSLYGINL
ncbi:ribbon-helix-helix protein, CopG family [Campylobacter sp. FMV-PI01]|uniref:Ribbon-helix-helix protein, CopG family n=1 Tax=Campylobacter portucalensis TaxID=2608384 RepID=A0A6L5WJG1_9BACT|nr:ribbon-helix-helix protein, CopG family [Campylobacter portucalensis]MSN97174.1 ribbon-helix-helix protein, CopG family [Campylobacter portucalensis]